MAEPKKKVELPVSLYDKIQKYIENKDYSSVEDYVSFVLFEHLASFDDLLDIDEDDEKKVKIRLQKLGYIN